MMKRVLMVGSALALVATAALALTTFDPGTGLGFAGKGDVQLALGGLNNAQIQAQASGLTFTYAADDLVEWDCVKDITTHSGVVHVTAHRHNSTTVSADVAYDARTRRQVTGFNLDGFKPDSTVTTIDGPAIGSCPADPSGLVFDPDSLTSSGGSSELDVSNGTTTGPLWVNGVSIVP